MRRVKWGIGAAVVVGAAWLLSNFFNMGGLGTGEGARLGLPTASTVPTTPETPPADPPPQDEPPEPSNTTAVATTGDDRSIGEGGVVDVLIDDRDYFLGKGAGDAREWVPAEQDAIAAYARQASGDESGIRVRIFRKPSARAASEDDLSETLRNVGLTEAEIDMPEKLVE